jgi:hypothetical protein
MRLCSPRHLWRQNQLGFLTGGTNRVRRAPLAKFSEQPSFMRPLPTCRNGWSIILRMARILGTGLLLLLGPLSCADSFSSNDSRYIRLGSRNGYYIVRPDSQLFHQLGLYEAPWIDTAEYLRHGYGADALAFRFNRSGVLIQAPAYIVQAEVSDFYTRRIGGLVLGYTTTHEVEALFGHGHTVADRSDGFIYYYALPVYNAAEDWGGGRR